MLRFVTKHIKGMTINNIYFHFFYASCPKKRNINQRALGQVNGLFFSPELFVNLKGKWERILIGKNNKKISCEIVLYFQNTMGDL